MSDSKRTQENRSARRFAVNAAVEMSEPGRELPAVYTARDVSANGVFVLTERPLPKDSSIRFTMTLKGVGAPEDGVDILCSGTVVRIESEEGQTGMAATISSYRFQTPSEF